MMDSQKAHQLAKKRVEDAAIRRKSLKILQNLVVRLCKM